MLPQEYLKLEFNIPIKMRDGTILYADIYRPDTKGKCPAILTRLPYDKEALFAAQGTGYMNPRRIARAGYAVIIQDCRGTGLSEGKYYPHVMEPQDGYDTVEWLAAQPWCNGPVGMYGVSYLGFTQWAAAVTQPSHLKAICPGEYPAVARGAPFFIGGIHSLHNLLSWCLTMSAGAIANSTLPPEKLKPLRERLAHLVDTAEKQCYFLPWKDIPAAKMIEELGLPTFFSDNLKHMDDDKYWEGLCSPTPIEKVVVPTFHLSGWYDITPGHVLSNYMEMQKRGGSELAKKNQKILIGPWVHGNIMTSTAGELDFGPGSTGMAIDVTGIHIRWFDHWLKNIDNGIMDEPPVRIFVMGDNVWRDESEWPLARTRYIDYYFHSGGRANSRFGDGFLSTQPPDGEETDIYIYDPRNPVPAKVGLGHEGARDQCDIEDRPDVLVYTSAPMEKDLEITGPIVVKLCVSSSAVDTDFTGKLVDVWPNGKAYNLVEGIIRARYRESVSKAKLIKPGKVYEYSINLGATSIVFKAGHMIRVEISSSNFPKYDRNLNTGHHIGQDSEIKVAVQTVFHNKEYQSRIVLPVIPRN
jgi:putative CocE/NonD family hydrolase